MGLRGTAEDLKPYVCGEAFEVDAEKEGDEKRDAEIEPAGEAHVVDHHLFFHEEGRGFGRDRCNEKVDGEGADQMDEAEGHFPGDGRELEEAHPLAEEKD